MAGAQVVRDGDLVAVLHGSNWRGAPGTHPFVTGAWRAPPNNTNAFARESQIDMMAAKAGMDALEFRLKHLKDAKMRGVLLAAAERCRGLSVSGQNAPERAIVITSRDAVSARYSGGSIIAVGAQGLAPACHLAGFHRADGHPPLRQCADAGDIWAIEAAFRDVLIVSKRRGSRSDERRTNTWTL